MPSVPSASAWLNPGGGILNSLDPISLPNINSVAAPIVMPHDLSGTFSTAYASPGISVPNQVTMYIKYRKGPLTSDGFPIAGEGNTRTVTISTSGAQILGPTVYTVTIDYTYTKINFDLSLANVLKGDSISVTVTAGGTTTGGTSVKRSIEIWWLVIIYKTPIDLMPIKPANKSIIFDTSAQVIFSDAKKGYNEYIINDTTISPGVAIPKKYIAVQEAGSFVNHATKVALKGSFVNVTDSMCMQFFISNSVQNQVKTIKIFDTVYSLASGTYTIAQVLTFLKNAVIAEGYDCSTDSDSIIVDLELAQAIVISSNCFSHKLVTPRLSVINNVDFSEWSNTRAVIVT